MRVTAGIVSFDSAAVLAAAIDSVRRQTLPCRLIAIDNASRDGTPALLERLTSPVERRLLERNTGFAAAHNLAIRETGGDYYLALNPDVVLAPDYCARLVEALDREPAAGAAGGKLLLAEPSGHVDSAGIVMTPAQRHLDRGQGERDAGQFDAPAWVFGVTGAAALYRRRMFDDVAVDGEVFDEDFFAYREDADLAWRAQLLGWRALYVPGATAVHARRVTPARRAALPAQLNRWSVRNRFLLRIKNQPIAHLAAFAAPALLRDAQVLGYVLLRERSSLAGLADVVRLWPRAWRKRRAIMARRRLPTADLIRWFREPVRPYLPATSQSSSRIASPPAATMPK